MLKLSYVEFNINVMKFAHQTAKEADSFVIPSTPEIIDLDFRFDGKDGVFKRGEKLVLEGKSIEFGFISQAHCFGNLGKLIKDVNFFSIIGYCKSGAFGRCLMRLFIKGDSLKNYISLIHHLRAKDDDAFQGIFKAMIVPIVKGEHSVYDLVFSFDTSKDSVKWRDALQNCLPGVNWYNNLPYINPLKHDCIVLTQQYIDEVNGEYFICEKQNYPPEIIAQCLRAEQSKKEQKILEFRNRDELKSLAQQIAQKYLKGN